MIGKGFRSLPFIFANDNYTLSLWIMIVTVHGNSQENQKGDIYGNREKISDPGNSV